MHRLLSQDQCPKILEEKEHMEEVFYALVVGSQSYVCNVMY